MSVGKCKGCGARVEGLELMCMVVMCMTVNYHGCWCLFLIRIFNPFLKKKRCFHTRDRGFIFI